MELPMWQAVALVFEHVLTESSAHVQPGSKASAKTDGVPITAHADGSHMVLQKSDSSLLAQHGAANAALKLLDELCMMATGEDMPTAP